jgi:NAD+ kinase
MVVERAVIAANMKKKEVPSLITEILSVMDELGIKCDVIQLSEDFQQPCIENCQVIFSLGGDGTVLYVSRHMNCGADIFAVNLGRVGFITEISRDEWKESFFKYLEGGLDVSSRLMINVSVVRNGRDVFSSVCLNDIVISSSGISKLVHMDVTVGKVPMGTYRADGIIVATPTGSTAYSAAAGGPILDPELEAFIINPICPFSLSNRPVVVDSQQSVVVDIPENKRSKLILTVDGQEIFPLETGDKIFFRKSEKKLNLIMSDKRNFFEVLRNKLNWSGGSHA